MSNQFIYGYGSLVNRATHDYQSHPARLHGWRRVWRHTTLRPLAFLTAVPDQSSSINGLIMQVPHGESLLEKREAAYDRQDVSHSVRHELGRDVDVQVYAIAEGRHKAASQMHPILLSYIDVVVQGYLQEFGTAGVQDFFETTDGWDAPILNDRHDPRYSRHRKLSVDETDLTDQWLTDLSAVVKQL